MSVTSQALAHRTPDDAFINLFSFFGQAKTPYTVKTMVATNLQESMIKHRHADLPVAHPEFSIRLIP